jgi:hypothetical protein
MRYYSIVQGQPKKQKSGGGDTHSGAIGEAPLTAWWGDGWGGGGRRRRQEMFD